MDPLEEINENFCRICLEDNVVLHWNDEIIKYWGTTYKDCYYKYTQLEIPDLDPFSQMLCQTCSIGLRNLHILIVKALESHTVLQQAYETQITAEECEETKEISESGTDNSKEFAIQPDNFEIVVFNQPNKESTTDDDNDDDRTNENNSCNVKRSEISTENSQEQRKRVRKRSSWLENGTFEVNIPKSNRRNPSSSSKEESNEKSKKIKKQTTKTVINPSSNKKSKKKLKTKEQIKNITETDDSQTQTKRKRKSRALKTYMCSICSKICRNTSDLLIHEDSHKGPQERSETCPQCGLKFWKKTVLQHHMKTHDLSRQKYQCEYCEKSYLNIAALNIHRRKHLGQMIPCPLCPKEFFRQVDLDRHNVAAHSAASIHKDIKRMPKYMVYCKECDKHLRTTSWRAHQANHLKEPLMKCSLCDKDFFSRNTCTYHMDKIHDFKKREEYEPFIIYLKARLTHLMLEQQATLEVKT